MTSAWKTGVPRELSPEQRSKLIAELADVEPELAEQLDIRRRPA